jgi:hypothetical protein
VHAAHYSHVLRALPQVERQTAVAAQETRPGCTVATCSAKTPRAHRSWEADIVQDVGVNQAKELRVHRSWEADIDPSAVAVLAKEPRVHRLLEAGIDQLGAWGARWPCMVARTQGLVWWGSRQVLSIRGQSCGRCTFVLVGREAKSSC